MAEEILQIFQQRNDRHYQQSQIDLALLRNFSPSANVKLIN